MKSEIFSHLNDPRQLEKMYRTNKQPFKQEFNALYNEVKGNMIADFWNERLNYDNDGVDWGNRKELVFVLIASAIAGIIAKLPALLNLNEELFYSRNVGFIVFPALTAYFAWKNKLSKVKAFVIVSGLLVSALFINSLPVITKSDSIILSCVHLVLVLWSILGFVFVGELQNNNDKRLSYLNYLGDLVVMSTLILIAGGILSGITIGLFQLIGFKIGKSYFEYIGIFGLAAAPIVGTYLTQNNPQLVSKISPVIAKIFSPLVLVMLVIYLIAIVFSGKNPYNDREFLLIFNGLLIGVMALIFFSVVESSKTVKSQFETWILFLLSAVTIVVNNIALSAIILRIVNGGITPNRAAVLGSNTLILINLLLVTVQLYKALFKKVDKAGVGRVIALFLPVYVVWAAIVTFLFPLIFGFK